MTSLESVIREHFIARRFNRRLILSHVAFWRARGHFDYHRFKLHSLFHLLSKLFPALEPETLSRVRYLEHLQPVDILAHFKDPNYEFPFPSQRNELRFLELAAFESGTSDHVTLSRVPRAREPNEFTVNVTRSI